MFDGPTWIDAFVALVLGPWFLATILNATTRGRALVFRSEVLSRLVPQWNFFAPTPGEHDFQLLYRHQIQDGRIEPWCAWHTTGGPRGRCAWLWNPGKYRRKALFDITVLLLREIERSRDQLDAVKLSIPYLLIANHLAALPRPRDVVAWQFTVVRLERGGGAGEVLFVSDLHAV
ncbi:MAG: hypothetical protein AAGC60_17125 [Acidobacteriota bacterium]